MLNKCVRCGTSYSNDSKNIISGCTCGSKLFLFRKNSKDVTVHVSGISSDMQVANKSAVVPKEFSSFTTNAIDFEDAQKIETIDASFPGVYHVNLDNLSNRNPIVYKIDDGKYIIDISKSFELSRKKII